MTAASPPQSDPVRQKAAPRRAPVALWRIAETFLALLYNLFGEPQDVARQHTLSAKTHALLASWLRAGEALMRRLLLIEASYCARPNTAPARASGKHVRRLMHFTPDDPDAWRVSFRLFCSPANGGAVSARSVLTEGVALPPTSRAPRDPLPRGIASRSRIMNARSQSERERGGRKEPRRFLSAWPLAERYEALLRVFNDPLAAARRLARRLYAKPRRVGEVLRASAQDESRIGDDPELAHAIDTAAKAFNSS